MMEERRAMDDPETFKGLRRGWFLGDKSFRKELLEQMVLKSKGVGSHYLHFAEEDGLLGLAAWPANGDLSIRRNGHPQRQHGGAQAV